MSMTNNANFINSVADGQAVPCPKCNAINKSDSKFCYICGGQLKNETQSTPAFAPAFEPAFAPAAEPAFAPAAESAFAPAAESAFAPAAEPAFAPAAEPAFAPAAEPAFAPAAEPAPEPAPTTAIKKQRYEEPASAFAEGLPEWDIIPPQVMVRRH